MDKNASGKVEALKWLGSAGAAAVWDQIFNNADWVTGEKGRIPTGTRVVNGLLNTGFARAGLIPGKKGGLSIKNLLGAQTSIPIKDLAIVTSKIAPEYVEHQNRAAKAKTLASLEQARFYRRINKRGGETGSTIMPWVVGTLGLGALGLGGVALWKYLQKWDSTDTKAEITVPGTKGDPYSAIKVQVPMDPKDFGNKLISGVTRGVKKKLRSNIKANSKKIDPVTGKKIPYEEWVMKYGDEDEKADLGYTNDGSTDKPLFNSIMDPDSGATVKHASESYVSPAESIKTPSSDDFNNNNNNNNNLDPRNKCRRPVPNTLPTMASTYIAPGGLARANYGNSRVMTLLARKNARQSGAILGEQPAPPVMQPKQAGFYVDTFDCNRLIKSASVVDLTARQEVSDIMNRIYNEDPSAWPYGLNIPGHDSVYLIRDKMTKQAAGFVGWQETTKNGKKIGSYSIGILPEYRHNGFAKEAVSKVLQIKSDGVDEVRAFIVDGNKPSERLANSLGVAIEKKF